MPMALLSQGSDCQIGSYFSEFKLENKEPEEEGHEALETTKFLDLVSN